MRILIDTSCPSCGAVRIDVFQSTREPLPSCGQCGTTMERLWSFGTAVRGDEIPGGILIEHGLCNADGSPRRFNSWSELNRECKARGMVRWVDGYTEDSLKDDHVRADWMRSSEAQKARAERVEARNEKRLAQAREAARR